MKQYEKSILVGKFYNDPWDEIFQSRAMQWSWAGTLVGRYSAAQCRRAAEWSTEKFRALNDGDAGAMTSD